MQGNDLVAEDIVARCNVLRNLNEPAVSIRDELVGSPDAWDCRAVDQTGTADLEELEGGLVDAFAASAAGGEVVLPISITFKQSGREVPKQARDGSPAREMAATGGRPGLRQQQRHIPWQAWPLNGR